MSGRFWDRSNQPPAQSGPPRQGGYSPVPPPQGNYGLPGGPRPGGRDMPPPQAVPPPAAREYDDYEKRALPRRPQPGADRSGGQPRQSGYGTRTFQVVGAPNEAIALSNCLAIHDSDFQDGEHVIVKNRFPVTVRRASAIQPGSVGASQAQREWMQLSAAGDVVDITPLDVSALGEAYLVSIDIEVSFLQKNTTNDKPYKVDDMEQIFARAYGNQLFSTGQILFWEFYGQKLKSRVNGLQRLELTSKQSGQARGQGSHLPETSGILMDSTAININVTTGSRLKLQQSAKKPPPNAILAPNFKFEDMGIGGLDTEFGNIFRRAFASRVFPLALVEKLGIQHVKGLLLYGPPGTGKTLMARQIGKMLNAREPKVVNGPEILNKYVGASEENVRKLFADAEKEYKEKSEESGLHIIIIDEIDAICKQRGSTGGGTGVGDSIVNQLLSKMDGVDQLNNILLIGMTNRLDMIDDALLRPGRLEVHMEVSLPDEHGRLQILNIHTAKMRANGVMESDVDLEELARETKNFSGAEISGLVKSATSWAFNRHIKVGTMAGISDDIDKLKVNRKDFFSALEEVKPAFGISEEELNQVIQNGIIDYSDAVETVLKAGELFVKQVNTSTRTPLVTTLLYGPPGSGKTALAATIAQKSGFPFIKIVSPEHMVGFSEAQKIAAVTKVFSDSYKSPISVIVVDNLERLIDWVQIGPRFSNGILQALMVLFSRRPPKGRRLLILATTSNRPMVTDIQLGEVFDSVISVPPISDMESLEYVIRSVDLFPRENLERSLEQVLARLSKLSDEGRLNVGVKKLLSMIEMARQEPAEAVDRFVQAVIDHHTGI